MLQIISRLEKHVFATLTTFLAYLAINESPVIVSVVVVKLDVPKHLKALGLHFNAI